MKKLIILTIVFLLLFSYGNLFAKKKGAELEIWGKGDRFITGELIAVKQNSLLLLDSGTGADVSIDIKDIKSIIIRKKSLAFPGLLVGGCIGGLIGYTTYKKPTPKGWLTFDFGPGGSALSAAIIFGLVGLVSGAIAGIDETIKIEGKSDLEIKKTFERLRKKARIPNYQ